jgi:hypothetical protein
LHFRLPALFLALKTLALFLMLVAGKSALDSGNLFLAVEPSACRDISCIEIGPLTSERTVLQTISPRSASRSTLRLFLSTASAIAAANHKLSLILRAGLVILSKRCASKSLVILSITRRRGAVRAGALSARYA